MNTPKKIGDMTPQERHTAVKSATRRFQEELDRTAPAIGNVLDEVENELTEGHDR